MGGDLHGPRSAAGTVLVRDINPGRDDGSAGDLTSVRRTLLFAANGGTRGEELWRSDGTRAGTVLVKDINRHEGSSNPSYLTKMGGPLFFTADDGIHGAALWKSDGTGVGTVLVKDFNPPGSGKRLPTRTVHPGAAR